MDPSHHELDASEAAGSVAEAFFRNASAPRVDTDAVILNIIQNKHPGVPVTTVPEGNCNLKAYAAAGYASIETAEPQHQSGSNVYPDTLKWTLYIPPQKRLDGGNGIVADEVFFESYIYKWQNMAFLVYFVDGRDGAFLGSQIRNQYILGNKAAVRTLVATAGRYQSILHDEIWVFNQGFWRKDPLLYRSIMKSHWEDVILDQEMKDDLIETAQRFFDSRDQYDRLRVPWKRGIIFHGPPGNGKTISIKATMHMLYNRTPPIPTLYVQTLVSFVPPEFSIETIFTKARQEAPCYLVFEDLDSLVTDQTRSFFLNAVDGLSENEGILMVGSTNHLERLDPGIAKRPSRFDRKYLFPNPNFDQRVKYCQYWQRKLKDNKGIEFPNEICEAAAKITDQFSFAYIQEAFVSALLTIARENKDDNMNGNGNGNDYGGQHEERVKEKETMTEDEVNEMDQVDEGQELQNEWDVLDITDECSARSTGMSKDKDKDKEMEMEKDKDLDDYILWRKLKYQVELLRKELSKGRGVSLDGNICVS
ncbi:uncharacterized protein Z518_04356 [Rhinocladiella mackenziei CBS 650.93]|uniref:ATPase AAA-type core domain-containing protein n=1 Tax=Rhinocladiella mackenziei CBS 650.93 TaxID=1442369 RepID=A0A0D2JB95_9EURO|nr:uncharacterized protein Z518_04356 [Rhinocladiella mackenziei CBS 650.93]KIX06380.1 hypothetical protein Z518_04356 [Rhinocladiella mackenziei CBS 650.93]